MAQFFKQYHSIKPYLVNDTPPPEKERLQSPEERERLDGLYGVHPVRVLFDVVPVVLVEPATSSSGLRVCWPRYRFIADSRDARRCPSGSTISRTRTGLFRCHSIMNCVDVCPKGLNPTSAIGRIKDIMVKRAV